MTDIGFHTLPRLVSVLLRRGPLASALSLGLLLLACKMDPVHFKSVTPSVSAPMVASKVETPVYIILDPAAVKDTRVTAASDAKPIELYEIRTFVTRDLVYTLGAFYTTVNVVEGPPEPAEPHIVVDVKITDMNTQMDKATATAVGYGGSATATAYRAYGTMDWAIALRHSDESEYFFSMSDHVVGDHPGTTIHDSPEMFRSVWEAALGRFLEKYTESGAHDRARRETPSTFDPTENPDQAVAEG